VPEQQSQIPPDVSDEAVEVVDDILLLDLVTLGGDGEDQRKDALIVVRTWSRCCPPSL
jgi:hypothetical protein